MCLEMVTRVEWLGASVAGCAVNAFRVKLQPFLSFAFSKLHSTLSNTTQIQPLVGFVSVYLRLLQPNLDHEQRRFLPLQLNSN
jgi:hypothetical protein